MDPAKKKLFREYAEAILLALVFALVIRAFVVQAYRIPSGSMIPTLLIGDQILVDKLVYKFTRPERGDIMVFQFPKDPSRDFIKRVVGLPGDTVEIRDRMVFINGEKLEESAYAYHSEPFDFLSAMPGDNYGPRKVPPDHYFVMGDNRENSRDSRWWGFLDEDLIRGKAFIIYWSRDIHRSFPAGFRWDRFGRIIR